jgi:hypothetical protein
MHPELFDPERCDAFKSEHKVKRVLIDQRNQLGYILINVLYGSLCIVVPLRLLTVAVNSMGQTIAFTAVMVIVSNCCVPVVRGAVNGASTYSPCHPYNCARHRADAGLARAHGWPHPGRHGLCMERAKQ